LTKLKVEGIMLQGKATTAGDARIFADFEKLSARRRKEAAEFIAYLKVKEELEATKETISDKDFLKSIMRGDEDFKVGRIKKWSEVKERDGFYFG
jgi:hypothetical protein